MHTSQRVIARTYSLEPVGERGRALAKRAHDSQMLNVTISIYMKIWVISTVYNCNDMLCACIGMLDDKFTYRICVCCPLNFDSL